MLWDKNNTDVGSDPRVMKTKPIPKDLIDDVYKDVLEKYCPIVNGNCKGKKCVSFTYLHSSPMFPRCEYLGVEL